MAKEGLEGLDNIEIDHANLYREESYTDLKVGTLQRLVPVKKDGGEDPDRDTIFIGQTQLMSQAGPIPLNSRIEAESLEDAIDKFPAAMKEAVDKMVEEVERYQREQAGRLVTPSQMGGGAGGLGQMGGGGQGGAGQGGGGNLIV